MIQQKNVSKISNKLFEAGGKKDKRIPEAVFGDVFRDVQRNFRQCKVSD
jgi:hypothetical protein